MAVRRGVLRGGVAAGRRDHRGDPPPACPPPWGPWKRLCIQMRRWKIIQIFIYSTDTYTHTRTHSKHTHVPCTQQAHTGTLHTTSTHRHLAHSKHTQAPCTQQAHTGTLHIASTDRHPAHSKHTQAPCTQQAHTGTLHTTITLRHLAHNKHTAIAHRHLAYNKHTYAPCSQQAHKHKLKRTLHLTNSNASCTNLNAPFTKRANIAHAVLSRKDKASSTMILERCRITV